MPNSRKLHEFVNENDSFEELVEKADQKRYSHELLTGVEGLGFEVAETIEIEVETLGAQELGWLWLVWEDYYDGDPTPQEAPA